MRGVRFSIHRHAASLHSHSCENQYYLSADRLEQPEGERNQERTSRGASSPGRMSVRMGCGVGDDELNIEVLCKFHHCLRNFKHRDKISPKILFFFQSFESSNPAEEGPLMKGALRFWTVSSMF